MIYKVTKICNPRSFLSFAVDKSKIVSFCTFKSVHKKDLTQGYFDFFEKIEKFRYFPVTETYAQYQHYRSGQKFHYYTLTEELKNIILNYDISEWKNPNLPEDIAFYNEKQPWFFSISHEEIYYFVTNDNRLMKDLKDLGIEFSEVM